MSNKIYRNARATGQASVGYSMRKIEGVPSPNVVYGLYRKPYSTIIVGGDKAQWRINVDKKFNWFQKKMLKWCLGFEVKENKNENGK